MSGSVRLVPPLRITGMRSGSKSCSLDSPPSSVDVVVAVVAADSDEEERGM